MTSPKYINLKKFNRFFIVLFSLCFGVAFSTPHDVMALESSSVSTPYWNAHWRADATISGTLTQYACNNAGSQECGSYTGWTFGAKQFTGTSRKSITQIALASTNNTPIGTGFEWAAITFSVSGYDAMNYDEPLISYQGSTRLVEPISGRRYFFPVSVLDSQRWVDFSNTGGSSVGNTTLTILYHNSSPVNNTGYVQLLSHLLIPNSAASTINFNVSQAIFFNDYADYLNSTNLTLEEIKDILEDIKEQGIDSTSQTLNEHREEDQQDMQNAQNDAGDAGDTSSADASADGQTLLQAFISFVNAITGASPSNCNIPMDTGFINFGTINLCSLNPPPAFQAISSIVVIGFAVPLSLAAARKMIELFRSFQT